MNNNLKTQFKNLKTGAHLLLIYREKEEWASAILNFIKASVELNEKIIYVSGEYSSDYLINILKNNNIDVEKLVKIGQLLILTKEQIYKNEFDIKNILELLTVEIKKAKEEGYNSFNITGEISWVLKQNNSFNKIIEYEKQVEEKLFKQFPIKALCRYNMEIFDEKLIKNIIELHPYIVWQNYLYENPYYISLDSFNSKNIYKKELEEWLNNIKHYKKEKIKHLRYLKEEKNKFKVLFDNVDDALFVHGVSENGFTNFEMVNQEACNILGYEKKELLNMSPKDIDSNKYNDDFYLDKFNKLINQRHVKFETEHVTKKGEIIPVENKSHFFNYNGRDLVLTVARDIRERLNKEKELKKKNFEIKEKNNKLNIINNRLNKLLSVINELSNYSIEEEKNFLKKLFRTSFEIIPQAEVGSVYLYKNKKVIFIDTIGHDLKKLNRAEIGLENFKNYSEVVRQKYINQDLKERVSNDKYKLFNEGSKEIIDTIAFDIEANSKIVGGISLDILKESNKQFDDLSIEIFSSFKDIAESFYKIQNYDKLRGEFTKELALSLIHILEFHDKYTIGHSENVALLASDFAEYINLDDEIISRVYWAGLVHDIGKIVIPSYILNKKGKLTKQEYDVVKKHPEWAYETLIRSNQLSDLANYVLYHHERWDGKGYPEGLIGKEIPLISQVISISDTWDAMRSNRVYREALSYNKAIEELQKSKDRQHSSKLVDNFIEMINMEKNIFLHK